MKHPTSRMLHAYWDRLRGDRAAPERAEIEPGQIRHLLADSLILELDLPLRSATLRLAGTRICALFGRELKGVPFAGLWRGFDEAGRPVPHGADPWRIVEMVALDTMGVVAGLRGTTAAGESLDLELVLLPLRHHGRTHVRALGTLSPVLTPPWLGLHPLVRLETTSLRVLSAVASDAVGDGLPHPLPAPANDIAPVRRGHLLVHHGGRP